MRACLWSRALQQSAAASRGAPAPLRPTWLNTSSMAPITITSCHSLSGLVPR